MALGPHVLCRGVAKQARRVTRPDRQHRVAAGLQAVAGEALWLTPKYMAGWVQFIDTWAMMGPGGLCEQATLAFLWLPWKPSLATFYQMTSHRRMKSSFSRSNKHLLKLWKGSLVKMGNSVFEYTRFNCMGYIYSRGIRLSRSVNSTRDDLKCINKQAIEFRWAHILGWGESHVETTCDTQILPKR